MSGSVRCLSVLLALRRPPHVNRSDFLGLRLGWSPRSENDRPVSFLRSTRACARPRDSIDVARFISKEVTVGAPTRFKLVGPGLPGLPPAPPTATARQGARPQGPLVARIVGRKHCCSEKWQKIYGIGASVAERMGFEPTIRLYTVYPLSRRAPSTARPPLQGRR